MQNVLLSICISSYNKGNKCVRLVQNLLTVTDDRFNVFICDDCSDEDTFQKLQTLQSSKVILVRNEKNVGPCKNWYKTIDCGDGKYVLQVLDRDDIDVKAIPSILDILENHSIGAGYIGKAAINLTRNNRGGNYAICQKGKEAFLAMGGVPIHPTGFLISKIVWDKGCFKKFFYQDEKYGIYPHSYILGIIAAKRNMLYMPIPFYTYAYKGENKRSAFYQKINNKDYWWLPNNVMKTANQLMLYLYHFADDGYKEEFIIKRLQEGLIRATRGYKAAVSDSGEMEHYGMETHEVSKMELLTISTKYYFIFRYILNKLGIQDKGIRKKLNKVWIENYKSLIYSI